jgi:phage tail sheath protein FI
MFDKNRGVSTWFPPSIKTVGVYLRTERLANMWDAPAGINRGNLPGVADLAFNPANDAEASQIYTKYINFAKQYPIEGFTLEGQKTTRTGDNAFNRVNVRRLLLRLERFVYQTLRQFIYEPNNVFTRRRAIASLDPTFSSVQSRGGLYAYKLVIDETNNTPDVIDRNEMRVAILVQPVKTAEFILVDMIVTRTGANFDEVLQEVL